MRNRNKYSIDLTCPQTNQNDVNISCDEHIFWTTTDQGRRGRGDALARYYFHPVIEFNSMWRCIHSNEAFCCQSANSVDVECLSALAVSTTAIYIQFHFQYDWMSGDQLFLPLAIVLFASSTHTYDIRTLTIQQTTLFLSLSMYFLLSLSLSVIVSGRETDWQEKRDLEKKASLKSATCHLSKNKNAPPIDGASLYTPSTNTFLFLHHSCSISLAKPASNIYLSTEINFLTFIRLKNTCFIKQINLLSANSSRSLLGYLASTGRIRSLCAVRSLEFGPIGYVDVDSSNGGYAYVCVCVCVCVMSVCSTSARVLVASRMQFCPKNKIQNRSILHTHTHCHFCPLLYAANDMILIFLFLVWSCRLCW